jgi:Fe-S oxidoreductase
MAAYGMGWIHRWSRLASLAPGAANLMMPIAKRLLGVAPQRQMPQYARRTFRQRYVGRASAQPDGLKPVPQVLLWPDTFNNYFHPDTAMAAVEVLEHAGYQVTIPRKSLCCGRPLYDWGFLDQAKKLLAEVMIELRPELDQGIPIVGLEPSCISVFRDELQNLFPGSRMPMLTLSEFIQREGDRFEIPRLPRKAIVQGHCHHKAIMKFEPEEFVLQKLGLDFDHLDSGCCGMAGAFGFEAGHYEISMRIGERVLLPSVREAAPDTLIIANGFSCREQIAQATGRRTLHLAEVLQMAMRGASS